MLVCVLGLLHVLTYEHSGYALVGAPMALVYGVCTKPESHDFFLVPLASVTPFDANAQLVNQTSSPADIKTMATAQMTLFHKTYGGVKKGLFSILFDNKVIGLEVSAETDDPDTW